MAQWELAVLLLTLASCGQVSIYSECVTQMNGSWKRYSWLTTHVSEEAWISLHPPQFVSVTL